MAELNAPGSIGADVAVVGLPGNAKNHNPIGFRDPFQNLSFVIIRVVQVPWHHRRRNLLDRLMVFGLVGIASLESLHELVELLLGHCHGRSSSDDVPGTVCVVRRAVGRRSVVSRAGCSGSYQRPGLVSVRISRIAVRSVSDNEQTLGCGPFPSTRRGGDRRHSPVPRRVSDQTTLSK